MSRTQTIYIDLSRLLYDRPKASLMIRLMMACNDIILANQCMGKFKEKQNGMGKHVQKGALMYFVRLQIGHLNETMGLIQEICDNKDLYSRINRCTEHTQDCFRKLANCLENGPDHKKFRKYITLVRHKTIFHYDGKLVDKALIDRANRPEASKSKITMGNHISLWRFELADDIVDSIVCRHIRKIPRSTDLRKQADEIADFCAGLCHAFIDFCGEFIPLYIRENAAI